MFQGFLGNFGFQGYYMGFQGFQRRSRGVPDWDSRDFLGGVRRYMEISRCFHGILGAFGSVPEGFGGISAVCHGESRRVLRTLLEIYSCKNLVHYACHKPLTTLYCTQWSSIKKSVGKERKWWSMQHSRHKRKTTPLVNNDCPRTRALLSRFVPTSALTHTAYFRNHE